MSNRITADAGPLGARTLPLGSLVFLTGITLGNGGGRTEAATRAHHKLWGVVALRNGNRLEAHGAGLVVHHLDEYNVLVDPLPDDDPRVTEAFARSQLLTTSEAANRLGLDPSQVRRLCASGAFPGAVHTNPANPARGEWQIPEAEVLAYQRGTPGWPKGKPRKEPTP